MHHSRRVTALLLAVADAALIVAGTVVAITKSVRHDEDAALSTGSTTAPTTTTPPAKPAKPVKPVKVAPRVSAAQVAARPWPARVTPSGPWSAHLEGTGPDLRIWAPLTVRGGAVKVSPGTSITFPDRTTWKVVDLPTADLPFEPSFLSGGFVQGSVAVAGRTLTGRFQGADGTEVAQLAIPEGTPPVPAFVVPAPGMTVVVDASIGRSDAGIEDNGLSIELAGAIKATALGGRWDGLVGSIEANQLTATATWMAGGWSVVADAASARQLWIDVWPVADTVLDVRSGYDAGAHSCAGDCSVRMRYANTGWATAQIMGVEAVGHPSPVDLEINTTRNHDAGLGLRRGGVAVNLGPGREVDAHLPPGARQDRGLTYRRGAQATLAVRGNFPDAYTPLAIPAAPPAERSAA